MLSVVDLQVWYETGQAPSVHAVRGVSFDVRPGERLGLVGESGSGKTTAMLAIAGLLPGSASVAGEVHLLGDEILLTGDRGIRPHRWRDVAVVFQGAMSAFSPVHTIGSQLAEPITRLGLAKGTAARSRVRELLDLVGVSPTAADRYPHELSGGMRQRAAIAMALACDPKLLIADEPTTALDVMVQAQVLRLLRRLAEEMHLALILVSHDLSMVAQVCDRIAVMYGGQVVEDAPTQALFDEPRHPYSSLLVAATPDIDDDIVPLSIPGTPPRLDRTIQGCSFAPRCPHAFHRCHVEEPQPRSAAQSIVRCHLGDEA